MKSKKWLREASAKLARPKDSLQGSQFVVFPSSVGPGRCTGTINGIPLNLVGLTGWACESYGDANVPHVGAATIETVSVNYDGRLGVARVVFDVDWNASLKVGVMLTWF